MPLSGAERQRRYLQKLKNDNPEKLEELKKKNLEQTKSKYRKVRDLDEKERELQREKWRKQKQNRDNKDISKAVIQQDTDENKKRRFRYRLLKENSNLKNTVNLLTAKTKNLKKCLYRYKKQLKNLKEILNRLQNPVQENDAFNVNITNENDLTPFSKIEKLTEVATPEKNMVKKVLFENIVLKESIGRQYSQASSNHERDTLKKVIANDITRKYKMKTKLSTIIGLKGRVRSQKSVKETKLRRLKELYDFFNRDDNSRASSGKKEYKTLHKKKEQVRYLLSTMKDLHTKYKNEGGKLSYATFTRYKPFYILRPNVTDRNTCACIKHANLSFMANKLKQLKVIDNNNLSQLVSSIACNSSDPKCMVYGECNTCSEKRINYNLANQNPKDFVTWKRWVSKKHEFKKNETQEKPTITKRTVKEEITQPLEILLQAFSNSLTMFKKHHFNINHQYKMYKYCKDNLSEQEILLHCDFSENYTCKFTEEVQSLHFGASKQQISLHTGVLYAKNQEELQTTSFCTISPNTNHGPGAIWAHLTPILQMIKEKYPEVTTIHFYSDGPTTQYRQKKNFYMLNKMILRFGFENASWSFFEASHGKGAADGIGGATKRNLDRYVTHGQDIPDADAAYNALINSDSKIKYFFVSDENIDAIVKDLDSKSKDLIPIPNTMSIHQVIYVPNTNTIKYRNLSCFCVSTSDCDCYNVKTHNLTKIQNKPKKRKIKQSQNPQADESDTTADSYINYAAKIQNKPKKRKIEKSKKKKEDDSDTTVESEINYAESDDSTWGCVEEMESDYGDDENIEENSTLNQVNNNINNRKEKLDVSNDRKVIILSDIKNTPENYRYFNLKNYSPLSYEKLDKHSNNKIKSIYEDPIPSTSSFNNDNSSKGRGSNFKEGRNKEIYQSYTGQNTEQEDHICENITIENETAGAIEIQNEMKDGTYNVSDSVLVRYYEKRSWVYYIGFIEEILYKTYVTQKTETLYRIKFLKTLKKPDLKFIISKKRDIDIVPSGCVVKIVDLTLVSNAFKLKNDVDQIYF